MLLPLNSYAQAKQESWQRDLLMNQRFENYKNDFIQFGQTPQARHSRNEEDLTDVGLMMVADQTVAHVECAETLVAIYLKVSNKRDRLDIWPFITGQIAEAIKRLNKQIEVTNAEMSQLHTPAAVAEALRMRDDLRQLTQDLDGAMKEIEAAEAKIQ